MLIRCAILDNFKAKADAGDLTHELDNASFPTSEVIRRAHQELAASGIDLYDCRRIARS